MHLPTLQTLGYQFQHTFEAKPLPKSLLVKHTAAGAAFPANDSNEEIQMNPNNGGNHQQQNRHQDHTC